MTWETVIHRSIAWNALEAVQQGLIEQVQSTPSKAFLLISEPLPTFTHGRNSDPKDLHWSQALLNQYNVQVSPVKRGGKWTFHGPGQILIYPIMHLPSWGYSSKAVRAFLEDFRESVMETLTFLGCSTIKKNDPFGVYINHKKLVSFGLAFERSISSHGMALYLTDQSLFFSGINPCGVTDGISTFLNENLPSPKTWDSVATLLEASIKKRFSFRLSRVV